MLRALESLSLGQFIGGLPVAVACINAKEELVDANAAFHALTGSLFVAESKLPFTQLIEETRRTEAIALFKSLLAGKEALMPQMLELLLPNGERVMVSLFAGRVQLGEEHLLLMQLIDVTEQKNLEVKFAHSQKMQAVGQLAGGVAHDFNNLLTAMIGFCDLLLIRHPAGDQSFADIMQIKQNANRAANLVRQLLAFSRRQTLQPKLLDITDVLAELTNLIRRLIGENIELSMLHGRDLGWVKADQGQLEQVLINLAVNARDAMKGGGKLTITSSKAIIKGPQSIAADMIAPAEEESVMPAGEYVLIEVADTGHGIPSHIVQKIFEPFFSTKEVGAGTGLGLSTVYGIIKQSGGYLFVKSKEAPAAKHGTTFYMYFPAHAAQEGAQVPTSAEKENAANDAADLTGNCKLLLVEDETPVRAFAARALKNKGYNVLEADCGETALEIMNSDEGKDVELIISDVIMPGMNGPAMIEQATANRPEIKVIFISGYAEDVFANFGSDRQFNFLPKPFTLKQLASKVKEVILQGK